MSFDNCILCCILFIVHIYFHAWWISNYHLYANFWEREREKFVEKAILNCTEKISFKQYLYDCSCSFASEYINFEESVFSIKIFNYSPVITNVFGLQLNLKQKKQNSWKPFQICSHHRPRKFHNLFNARWNQSIFWT